MFPLVPGRIRSNGMEPSSIPLSMSQENSSAALDPASSLELMNGPHDDLQLDLLREFMDAGYDFDDHTDNDGVAAKVEDGARAEAVKLAQRSAAASSIKEITPETFDALAEEWIRNHQKEEFGEKEINE